MAKKLSDMSLEELWRLFPIILTEPSDEWGRWYSEECCAISKLLDQAIVTRISHVGSTAINGIWAKPIVDILIEIQKSGDLQQIKKTLVENGYICMAQDEKRISLNKGYTEHGFDQRVFHLHLRFAGDNDELYFRDFMNENPALASEYEKLKLSLWKIYQHNRDGYTEAKGSFVIECTAKARMKYGNRYDSIQ